MKNLAFLFVLTFIATPSIAEDALMGCFVRDYSKEHLQQSPEQVVDRMSILFTVEENLMWADVQVLLADQGHAARDGFGGMRLSEAAGTFNGPLEFGVECDGGSFDVVGLDGTSVTIETSRFRLSANGCGGEGFNSDLHETGSASTRYKLNRAETAACQW
jgi:hypothetical protein